MPFAFCSMADVRKIENLEECVNLQELNLSGNELSAIEGLHRLHNLRKLTLTSNKITSLGGLEKLEALEHVLIQDNDISNIAEIAALAGASPACTCVRCSLCAHAAPSARNDLVIRALLLAPTDPHGKRKSSISRSRIYLDRHR
jgi:Leucine-rich repeat (LRR) protein